MDQNYSQFNESFIKIYNEEIAKWYFLEVDIQYLEKLQDIHNGLPLLPKIMKIEKVEMLVANLHYKTGHVINIRNLKHLLNHGLALKKVHRVIKFNQNAWLKPHMDINTDLRKKSKKLFILMNNAVLGKTIENVRTRRDIKFS